MTELREWAARISLPQMKQPLSNKVAIVTGASRGIGRAIALKLAEEGAAVMLAARNAELLKEVQAEIGAKEGGPSGCRWIFGNRRRRHCWWRRPSKRWAGLISW